MSQNGKDMNTANYTKIIACKDFNNESFSLGFRRYVCLPAKLKKSLSFDHMIKNKTLDGGHNEICSRFAAMTDLEYKNYVITH